MEAIDETHTERFTRHGCRTYGGLPEAAEAGAVIYRDHCSMQMGDQKKKPPLKPVYINNPTDGDQEWTCSKPI